MSSFDCICFDNDLSESLPILKGRLWSSLKSKALTKLHSVPSDVATIVAARGMLYMRANSPKKPEFSNWLTLVSLIIISYVPLKKELVYSVYRMVNIICPLPMFA